MTTVFREDPSKFWLLVFYAVENTTAQNLFETTGVVGELEYVAKSRGHSVDIGHPRKVISQKKSNQTQKLIYMKKAGRY